MSAFLTDADLAEKFGISREQVQQRCRTAQWPHLRVGKFYRFTDADLDAIVQLHSIPVVESTSNPWGSKRRRSA